MKKIGKKIIEVFPNEILVCYKIILYFYVKLIFSNFQETYFIEVPRKKPGGLLYTKYHNYLSKLRSNELLNKKKKPDIEIAEITLIGESCIIGIKKVLFY